MPGNSKYKAFIPFDSGSVDEAQPIDAGTTYTLINNAIHLGDQSAQVRVNLMPHSASTGGFRPYHRLAAFSDTVDNRLFMVWQGSFPCRLKTNAEPFKLRCRLMGVNQPVASVTTDCYFVLAVGRDANACRRAAHFPDQYFDQVITGSTSSEQPEWLTGAVLTPSTEPPRFWSNGATRLVRKESAWSPFLNCQVWVSSSNMANDVPSLAGLQITEFVG